MRYGKESDSHVPKEIEKVLKFSAEPIRKLFKDLKVNLKTLS